MRVHYSTVWHICREGTELWERWSLSAAKSTRVVAGSTVRALTNWGVGWP